MPLIPADERRDWAKPIGLVVLAMGGLFIVMMILALIAGA